MFLFEWPQRVLLSYVDDKSCSYAEVDPHASNKQEVLYVSTTAIILVVIQ